MAVVLAAVTARVPDVHPGPERDWDAEFWAVVAGLDVPVGAVTRCHDGGGDRPVPPRHLPGARWRPVVRRPAGRERSPPAGGPA